MPLQRFAYTASRKILIVKYRSAPEVYNQTSDGGYELEGNIAPPDVVSSINVIWRFVCSS